MISLNILLQKHKLVLFGDDHNMNQGRYWLANEIGKVTDKIDFLALEYIETSKQFLLKEPTLIPLKKYLQEAYSEFP
jgi:hypothetical protein